MPIAALALSAAVLLGASQYFVYVYAPMEQTMGLVQKIFYTHLPMAWWGMFSFFLVFVASIAYLRGRNPDRDLLAQAAAEAGVLFSGLALITGSIWGRAAWNVWWTWDPRLTTTLVMWFIFAAYLAVRASPMAPERRMLVSAVLGIVGFLDVPLVFYSARMWRSIHPSVIGKGGGMEPEMWHAMFVSLAGFGLLWAAMLLARYRVLVAANRAESLAVQRDWSN